MAEPGREAHPVAEALLPKHCPKRLPNNWHYQKIRKKPDLEM
jgi:hypothetical protein